MRPRPVTANQLVAYRTKRLREERGLTGPRLADKLREVHSNAWNKQTISQLERVDKGTRKFDADLLLALSRVFDVPVSYFFIPPPAGELSASELRISSGRARSTLTVSELVETVFSTGAVKLWETLRELPPNEIGSTPRNMAKQAFEFVMLAARQHLDELEGWTKSLQEVSANLTDLLGKVKRNTNKQIFNHMFSGDADGADDADGPQRPRSKSRKL